MPNNRGASSEWDQLHRVAIIIDAATVSPKNRLPRDDQGQVLDNAHPEPLVTVVTQTLTCLRDELGGGEGEAHGAVRHLLQALVPALARIKREVVGKRKKGRRRK